MDYEKLRKGLVRKAYHLCRNREDAEDLAHEAFCYAWEKLGEPEDEDGFAKLCFGKLKLLYYDLRRRERTKENAYKVIEEYNNETILRKTNDNSGLDGETTG